MRRPSRVRCRAARASNRATTMGTAARRRLRCRDGIPGSAHDADAAARVLLIEAVRVKRSAVALVIAASAAIHAQRDWAYYGQDPGGSKYSTLDQINTANVAKLE